MRTILTIPAFVLGCLLLAAGPAWAYRDCATKEQMLERKIAIAKSRGNANQVEGLERALVNVRRYCTDASQRGKAEMKLLDKREEVMEREADLETARLKGDAKNIAKREKKLREAQAEAAKAERELNSLNK